jgi:hypothetical protein
MHLPEQSSRNVPVRENMALQIRGWQIERLGWYGLLLLMALALAGLFSKGPLSHVQTGEARMYCRSNTSVSPATVRKRR